MPIDPSSIGQDKQYKTPEEAHDAECGRYDDAAVKLPQDEALPIKANPQAPDPTPFSIGPLSPGGRSAG